MCIVGAFEQLGFLCLSIEFNAEYDCNRCIVKSYYIIWVQSCASVWKRVPFFAFKSYIAFNIAQYAIKRIGWKRGLVFGVSIACISTVRLRTVVCLICGNANYSMFNYAYMLEQTWWNLNQNEWWVQGKSALKSSPISICGAGEWCHC